ncbi:hypothetical protein Kpho02_64420 [Kitasatospora phosalacinea]|uniref:Uncharacterized protein n=1 Tax=Kitasatospora phosalacinea TaxID=2065 RepID=A0A9W6QDG4_9ACTN|nr:hypothetical protein [Kitasatospora phosalacinea]GLW74144.1 hypothetical protein Kpho02_64420 [Kitasatospora phosalacinea]
MDDVSTVNGVEDADASSTGKSGDAPAAPGSGPDALPARRAALLADAQPYCLEHALALAGSDALRLHGLAAPVLGTDLLLVTAEGPPLAELAAGLAGTLRAAGHRVETPPGTARRHQLAVHRGESSLDSLAGEPPLGIELRREPLRHPPTLPADAPVPVAALDDVAALAVLTLCERALPADLRALHALTDRRREGELLALASAFDEDLGPRTLADRLESAAALLSADGAEAVDTAGTGGTGSTGSTGSTGGTVKWAESWAQDLRLDLLETTELADGLHDPYLDRSDDL